MANTLTYSAAESRRFDRERFVACLFAPAEKREALFALIAFNLEIAKIRETVSEVMIGHIRLQWWRETIEGIYAGTVRQHAVAEALAAAIEIGRLPREAFDRMIDARGADLEETPPETLALLEQYAGDTAGELAVLSAQVLGADEVGQKTAKLAGTALGLAGLLRAIPFRARFGRVDLPVDLLQAAGLRARDVLDLSASQELSDVVAVVADRAHALIAEARRAKAHIARPVLPALLPVTLAERHLQRLRSTGNNPFDRNLARPDAWLGLALAVQIWRGRY
jgi:phytoene synthase